MGRTSTKKFSGKKNTRKVGALQRLKDQFVKMNKRESPYNVYPEEAYGILLAKKKKEMETLDSRITEQSVAESRRTKKFRGNTTSLRSN